jgi:hypothetical protein
MMRIIPAFAVLLLFVLIGCKSQHQTTQPVTSAESSTPKVNSPLPERAYKADLSLVEPLTTMKAGEKKPVRIRVKNASDTVWLVYGINQDTKYRVAVADSWLDSDGQLITNMDGRYGLPADLAPGRDVEVPLLITAPTKPGKYILQIDMVQEGVTWFQDKGSPVLKVNVQVT